MAQRASVQYLECRRSVTAKVDEVKLLDEQIAAAFQQITALAAAPDGEEELSDEVRAAAKSVGRLEVTLASVEGEEPVPDATITVSLDPEYTADAYETVEEIVERKDVVVTDEAGNVVEDEQVVEMETEHTPRKLKTTTKITRTITKKRVKREKAPEVRTIAWTAGTRSENEEENVRDTRLFPVTFAFDPVQSRETVVIITVATAAAAADKDDGDAEPVKEIEIPVSSLFHDNALDKWYAIVDEQEEEEELTTITELVEETMKEAIDEVVSNDEAGKTSDEAEEKEAEALEAGSKVADAAEASGKIEVEEQGDETDATADGGESTEKADESGVTGTANEAEAEETAEDGEVKNVDETEAAEEGENDEVSKAPKLPRSRFHVKATFELSDAEKLSISVVALSKKKQEAEAELHMLEREAANLRIKYDRLNASQRQLSASSISKPKSNLLGGRFGTGGVPMQRKSWYQRSRDRATAFVTKHEQLLVSVAMFAGSVCLFHYNGENLLA
ncbi:unnamed protein product [Hyaloperonospora brassicae]|uniref:Uncharacterized protein n=1 Tax=Hyaloperonospora brassicae TaxID=162125 RepID=A0AAV0SZR6_HYABA|nr:unnamed protein product [Hyaloperonospora brassicae]